MRTSPNTAAGENFARAHASHSAGGNARICSILDGSARVCRLRNDAGGWRESYEKYKISDVETRVFHIFLADTVNISLILEQNFESIFQ